VPDTKVGIKIAKETKIVRLKELPLLDLQPLLVESRNQDFNFLDWLVEEYASGANRFDQPGEALFAIYSQPYLIAIGGLNGDPYLQESGIGRVRRVYVLSSWRRKGIGQRLMQQIVAEARLYFRLLTLRTFDERADKFYRAIGFQTEPEIDGATHHLKLQYSYP
jgi:GNAT superfamily N-acetyltransferase